MNFQSKVRDWLTACFPAASVGDRHERMHRFLEEALELAQATGCSKAEALELVDYVFAREIGETRQEVGGVMVTLAGLCHAADVDLEGAAEAELNRNWNRIDVIRAKQVGRPANSALPQ
jgi:NTP pyrophosphatase (non-canonical NTP hydrolase)